MSEHMCPFNGILNCAKLMLASLVLTAVPCLAQVASDSVLPGDSDQIIFVNGDHLSGHVRGTTRDSIRFLTKAMGEVNISIENVKEIRSNGRLFVFTRNGEIEPSMSLSGSQDVMASSDNARILNVDARSPAEFSSSLGATPSGDRSLKAQPLACSAPPVNSPKAAPNPDWSLSITTPPESVVLGTQSQQTLGGFMTVDVCETTQLNDSSIAIEGKHTKSQKVNSPSITTDTMDGYFEQKRAFSDPYGTGIYGRAEMFFNTSLGMAMQRSFAIGLFSPIFGGGKKAWSFSAAADARYVNERLYSTLPSLNLAGIRLEEQAGYHTGRFGFIQEAWILPMLNDVHALQGFVRGGPCVSLSPWLSANLTEEEHYLGNAPAGDRKNYLASTLSLTIQNGGTTKACR